MTFDFLDKRSNSKFDLDTLKKPFVLKRQWVVFFACSSAFIMTLVRYNLSVAIIAILEEEEEPISNYLNQTANETDHVQMSRKKYQFDDFMVGQILSSYFYGYTAFQFPAGRLSELFGAKWLLGLATLASGILSFASPFLLDLSPIALIICRVIIGSLHASVMSCSYTFYAEWLPSDQKSKAITLTNISFELGGKNRSFCNFLIFNLFFKTFFNQIKV